MNYRSLASLGMTLLLAVAQLSAQERFEFKELHMGMEVRIVFYNTSGMPAPRVARWAYDEIARLENIMSDYRPESELRRLEQRAGEWVPVSPELHMVLGQAMDVARATEGAFDVTAAPLVHVWREARRVKRLPDRRAIDSARALVGWRRIERSTTCDGRSHAPCVNLVRLQPGTRIDLGGIAKGFIVNRVAMRFAAMRMSALIEAGGDLAAGRAPPGEPGWRIESGDSTIALVRAAVSTSGPQEQFAEIGGVRYSHVVDPRTGMALTNNYSATVVHRDGALADALSTALTVLGPDGIALVRQRYPEAIASLGRP